LKDDSSLLKNIKEYINQINSVDDTVKFSLRLANNDLTDESCELFTNLAKRNLIKNINISFNKFTDEGRKKIFDSLKNSEGLTGIKHTSNMVCDLNFLSGVIESNSSLIELDLTGTLITDDKLKILVEALQANSKINSPGINSLTLNRCYLTNVSAIKIAKFLKNNKSLKKLNLNQNSFNSDGLKYLFRILSFTPSPALETLDIQNNRFGIKVLHELFEVLKNNSNLHTLFISGNFPNITKEHTINKLLEYSERNRYYDINSFNFHNDPVMSKEEKIESLICRKIHFPKDELVVHCGTSDIISPMCNNHLYRESWLIEISEIIKEDEILNLNLNDDINLNDLYV
jgi:hypothetical protein